jgi:Tfp pilus assembly protein PilV
LVELLVTIVVLAFGCLAAVKMQGDALRGGALADHLTVAALLAESEMERLKSLTRSQLDAEVAAGDKEEPQLNRLGEACPDPPDCPGYIYGRRVRFFAGMPTTFSHQAEITVSWNEAAGAKSVLYSGVMTPLSF